MPVVLVFDDIVAFARDLEGLGTTPLLRTLFLGTLEWPPMFVSIRFLLSCPKLRYTRQLMSSTAPLQEALHMRNILAFDSTKVEYIFSSPSSSHHKLIPAPAPPRPKRPTTPPRTTVSTPHSHPQTARHHSWQLHRPSASAREPYHSQSQVHQSQH